MLEWFSWDTWLALLVLFGGVLFFYLRERHNFLRHHNQMRWMVLTGVWMAGGHLVLLATDLWWDGLLIGLIIGTVLFIAGEIRHWTGNWWRRMTGRRIKK
jgi:uncharacterized membrane protein